MGRTKSHCGWFTFVPIRPLNPAPRCATFKLFHGGGERNGRRPFRALNSEQRRRDRPHKARRRVRALAVISVVLVGAAVVAMASSAMPLSLKIDGLRTPVRALARMLDTTTEPATTDTVA